MPAAIVANVPAGPVRARTTAGKIDVTIRESPAGDVDLRTTAGDVELEIAGLTIRDSASVDLPDVLSAIDLHIVHGVAFCDALVVAAAKRAGCRVLYSEDLQTGRRFEGLEIVDPFA